MEVRVCCEVVSHGNNLCYVLGLSIGGLEMVSMSSDLLMGRESTLRLEELIPCW